MKQPSESLLKLLLDQSTIREDASLHDFLLAAAVSDLEFHVAPISRPRINITWEQMSISYTPFSCIVSTLFCFSYSCLVLSTLEMYLRYEDKNIKDMFDI